MKAAITVTTRTTKVNWLESRATRFCATLRVKAKRRGARGNHGDGRNAKHTNKIAGLGSTTIIRADESSNGAMKT